MKITKYGHSCFLVEVKGKRILFDPGDYFTKQNTLKKIDAIVVTHKHSDHMFAPNLKRLVKSNKEAVLISNTEVKGLLEKEGLHAVVVEDVKGSQKVFELDGVKIEAIGNEHFLMYKGLPHPQVTSYIVNNELLNTSDAQVKPASKMKAVIYVSTAPWLNLTQIFDYVISLKPEYAIPAHDGNMKDTKDYLAKHAEILAAKGIKLLNLNDGKTYQI